MKGRQFNSQEAQVLEQILQHRRDVRGNRFLPKPISQGDLERILLAATTVSTLNGEFISDLMGIGLMAAVLTLQLLRMKGDRQAFRLAQGTEARPYR